MQILHFIIAFILRTYTRQNRKCEMVPGHKFFFIRLLFALQFLYFTLRRISRFHFAVCTSYMPCLTATSDQRTDGSDYNCRWQTSEFV